MRALLGLLSVLLLPACSPFESESGFGSRLAPASCIAAAASTALDSSAPASYAPGEWALETAPVPRAVTYNLHSGLGPQPSFARSRAAVERHLNGIAAAIAALPGPADIVGLNEVDFPARRSGGVDGARYLAQALERRTGEHYDVVYGETWRRRLPGFEVRFGNAALVRHPVIRARACLFDDIEGCAASAPAASATGVIAWLMREPRGFIELTLELGGRPIDVIVTHFDAFALAEREAQAAHLVRRIDPRRATLILGDFNAVPMPMTHARAFFAADRTHDILTSGEVADARALYVSRHGDADFKRWATYPAAAPVWPLDGILASVDLVPRDVKVVESRHSDHHGLYVEYRFTDDVAVVAARRARHDAIRRRQLARILQCDLTAAGPAQWRWLLKGTQFLSAASVAQQRVLLQITPPL